MKDALASIGECALGTAAGCKALAAGVALDH